MNVPLTKATIALAAAVARVRTASNQPIALGEIVTQLARDHGLSEADACKLLEAGAGFIGPDQATPEEP